LDQSLKRLDLDYVDIFYAHRPDPETPLEETMEALDLIVRQGKALYVGVSNFAGARFAEAVRITRERGLVPITLHQPGYNLLNRTMEWDLLDHAERSGTGVIVYSPLAQGILTDKYLGGIPGESRAALRWGEEEAKRRLSADTLEKVRRLNEIAKARGQTLAQMAIAWILRLPQVTSVLVGASRVEQIEENVKALENLSFTREELEADADELLALARDKSIEGRKRLVAVAGTRTIGKADMKLNDYLPRMEVDPETYEVRADGVLLTCEPAATLPLAQRYFLF